ncbi:MAG: endonuclease III [Clostridia bacterium]|nr:endonuclease III [Clostridia bacterium]
MFVEKVDEILAYFDELHPNPKCALNFSNSFELLVSVVLSAQCTDERVNIVTKELFKLANTPEKMLALGEQKIKQIIYPCGFYNNKSKAILSLSNDLVSKFNGQVPSTMEELISLSGVGRKTANVVIGVAFGGQTIAVDTHVHRVSKRLGLTKENSTPKQCEQDLLKVIPYEHRTKFHHQAIWFGRLTCKAQRPLCETCKLKDICKYYKRKKKYELR